MNIADKFALHSGGTKLLACIYHDGVVLYIGGEANRDIRAWEEAMGVTETYRSADGTATALVVRGEPAEVLDLIERHGSARYAFWYEVASVNDNRHMDDSMLDWFLARFGAPNRAG